MSIVVDLCQDADMDRVFRIMSDTFKHDEPYIDAVYPKHDTPAGHAQGVRRMLQQKTSDPTARCIKATNTQTGKVVGLANWLCLENKSVKDQLDGDFWDNDDDKDFAQRLYAQFAVCRRTAVQSATGPVWSILAPCGLLQSSRPGANRVPVLDLLAVDPEHQNGGAGTKLIGWGLRHADEVGAEVSVDWINFKCTHSAAQYIGLG